ncbi:disintegrin and metalloproteinase domain-containing protein 12-like isoform X2 [Tetranychus urticae]|uniref:disintegrin and metalloproteinase domain-containing protein 12-like isoform X2 n=1 Tax=Tetranychus urticae TaxID=32264 RepID=UPI000D6586B2|nr:disintegrin and metalloproteinase domain-containing protein 12-like isoform X2 [Tetranychus urticae]
MQIQPVFIVSLLFICNFNGLDVDANQNITQCIPNPLLICTKNNSDICVDPKVLLIASPFHGNLTFQLEPATSKYYLIEANGTECIFTGKMNGTSHRVRVNTCSYALKNSTLVICFMINNDSWLIEFNETKECYQIQLSQCYIGGIIPIDTYDGPKPENILRVGFVSSNHLFDPKFLMSTPRYVEVGIVIDCMTKKFSTPNQEIYKIFKRATQLLTQMNIFSILTVIERFDTLDKCNESRTYNADIGTLLSKFREYIRAKHDTLGKYDVIVRITAPCKCNALGLAGVGIGCDPSLGDAVVRDGDDYLFASTFAHEVLHTFGVVHDDDEEMAEKAHCPYAYCVMYSSSHKPELGEYCGDYSLNGNEQCDCLDVKHCSKCCNPSTCLLLEEAKCGHGPCCNFETCELYKSTDNHVCRPAKSDCDIEERCDGSSQFCPPDLHVHDGWSCEYGQGHCFNGKCGSYHLSCDKIFENSEPAPDSCYEKNTVGDEVFNCGPPSKYFEIFDGKATKCKKKDVKCGRLLCTDSGSFRSTIRQAYARTVIRSGSASCRGVRISRSFRRNETDLGLVPDGAPCAPNKMCLNQECIPVPKFIETKPCPINCQNRGKCTNQGTCICNNPKDKSPDCSFSPITSSNWTALFRYFETTIQLIVMVVVTSTWIWIQANK